MPSPKYVSVSSLALDLHNFRTVPQSSEKSAIEAIIATRPEWFWALMESILENGYHPTDNILVLEIGSRKVVREGNRRIAAMKLIFGYAKGIEIPTHLETKIASLTEEWKKSNLQVPCVVYTSSEESTVDKLVSLTHARGEKAGRDKWNTVARARFARDKNGESVPALDLLEAYLQSGKNCSKEQTERWAGDFPITLLNEALQKLAPYLGFKSTSDLTKSYPSKNKRVLDQIMYDIGLELLGFKQVRDQKTFFGIPYGVQPASAGQEAPEETKKAEQGKTEKAATAAGSGAGASAGQQAYAANDPKTVRKLLRSLKLMGPGREKVVTLITELRKIGIQDCPHAFCFVLRSVFELSAKAYCQEHSAEPLLKTTKSDGTDKRLDNLLGDITKHLTKNGKDRNMMKKLHGAITELSRPSGLLSVTSMNQLVHNPKFLTTPSDICTVFSNVFPLLEEMNSYHIVL